MAKPIIGIGDPIEVKFVHQETGEFWRPATVQYVDGAQVVAVFGDGTRYTVSRKQRPPRVRLAPTIKGAEK